MFSLLALVILPSCCFCSTIQSLSASLTSDQDLASSPSSNYSSSSSTSSSSSVPGSTASSSHDAGNSRVSMSHPLTSRSWMPSVLHYNQHQHQQQHTSIGVSNYSFPDAAGNFTLTSSFSPLLLSFRQMCVRVIVTFFLPFTINCTMAAAVRSLSMRRQADERRREVALW